MGSTSLTFLITHFLVLGYNTVSSAQRHSFSTSPFFLTHACVGLFFGEVNGHQAFPYPGKLSEDEAETVAMLIDPVARFFAEKVDSKQIDAEARIPPETLDGLRKLGLFGLQIPESLGGLGLSNTAYARTVEEVEGLPSSSFCRLFLLTFRQ